MSEGEKLIPVNIEEAMKSAWDWEKKSVNV